MLKRLWSPAWESQYESNTRAQNGDMYLELNRLNIFIGKNNSGKSRLLRKILSLEDAHAAYTLDVAEFEKITSLLSSIQTYIIDNEYVNDIRGDWVRKTLAKEVFDLHDRNKIAELKQIRPNNIQKSNLRNLPYLNNFISKNEEEFTSIDLNKIKAESLKKIYVPVLRGMRPLNGKNSSLYKERTYKDYTEIHPDIILTGEAIYSLLTEHLLGLPDQRDRIKKYEELLSKYFFDDEQVNLIPKHDNDVVNILIGTQAQRPMYNVGDGLQQILIITSAAFLYDTDSMVFIEEPEINLHPGLLRQLISFLLNETTHQYFVTTHSNHLLDFQDDSSDCNLFKVTKSDANTKFSINKIGKDKSLLFDLGIRSSSVLISNCTIWVEGITDRLYIKEFLKKYFKKNSIKPYIENYHYSFVEYQGSNITHWDFDDQDKQHSNNLKAIKTTSQPLVVADGDVAGKKNRIEKLKEELGESFYLLKGKEIENYLPLEVVKFTTRTLFKKFTRNKYKSNIDKIDSLNYSDYKKSAEGLGNHIDVTIGCDIDKEQRIFSTSSTTLSDKLDFCQLSTEFMRNEDWELTPEINELCQKIVSHIKTYNS